MLRSCGFVITNRPGHETYLAVPDQDGHGAATGWNRSEYLSALGRDWQQAAEEKTRKK